MCGTITAKEIRKMWRIKRPTIERKSCHGAMREMTSRLHDWQILFNGNDVYRKKHEHNLSLPNNSEVSAECSASQIKIFKLTFENTSKAKVSEMMKWRNVSSHVEYSVRKFLSVAWDEIKSEKNDFCYFWKLQKNVCLVLQFVYLGLEFVH